MLNYSVLQGRLVRDPELRTTQSGTAVCSFTVAWSEKYKETETRLFLNCTAWRGTAEMVSRYFSKGKEIIVEGSKRSNTEMTVERVNFCGPKQAEGSNAQEPSGGGSSGDFQPIDYDDGELPF